MLQDLLVGSTGFVGQNLAASHAFAAQCHSTDIENYYGSAPELCVYCGVPSAMYLANADSQADLRIMEQARENIRKIGAKKTVLISSVTVYEDSRGKDENTPLGFHGLPAYGKNRLQLEQWVREDLPDALILRLPALYGIGLKKNFLFDLHTVTPAMLREDKYRELAEATPLVGRSYEPASNGFYKLSAESDRQALLAFFRDNDFNALAFTDSRSRFQFYPLSRLWSDIRIALDNRLTVLNLATPPLSAKQVYCAVTGNSRWDNLLNKEPFDYDMRTCHAGLFGGSNGYLLTAEEELADICRFMKEWA